MNKEVEQIKNKIKELIELNEESEGKHMFGAGRAAALKQMLAFIDSLIVESLIVYVVTRCEEHSDYVEEVFLDEDKATAYCKLFENNEDEYARHITKIKVTS
jgi:hypothetical protein